MWCWRTLPHAAELHQVHSNTDPPHVHRPYGCLGHSSKSQPVKRCGSLQLWQDLELCLLQALKINGGCFWSLMAPCLLPDSNARRLWSWTLQIELCPWGKAISSSQEASFVELKVEMTCEESFQWISKTQGLCVGDQQKQKGNTKRGKRKERPTEESKLDPFH